MTLRRLFATALALALLASAPDAAADEKAAGEHFRAGTAAFAKRDFRAAAGEFERAYREAPRGAAIYNAAMAWDAAGDQPRAADALATALTRSDLDSTQAETARTKLAAAQKSLGRLDITAPAGATVTVAHVERVQPPVTVHVKPGTHSVTLARSDGTSDTRSVSAGAGAVVPVAFAAPAASPATVTETPAAAVADTPTDDGTKQKKIGLIIAGSSLVGVAAATVFGILALSAKSDFDDSQHTDADAHDRADSFRTVANVGWVAAATLAVTGAVIWLAAPKAKQTGLSRPLDFAVRF